VEIQTKLGTHETVMSYAPNFIRDHMPEQHRAFYAGLPMFLVGSIDHRNRPWASAVFGQPGFLRSPDPAVLQVRSPLVFGDPLKKNLKQGSPLGFLGLEFHTRRRNRLTGKVTASDDGGFQIAVDQAFGNCPQYIQARNFEVLPEVAQMGAPREVKHLNKLDQRARQIISRAECFFIATHYSQDADNPTHGTDISHRGGKAGFVKIEDERTLIFPDFAGNNHFNTLGNIRKNPLVGLLFTDFDSGDLLYLTCSADIVWDCSDILDFEGAQRMLRFVVDEAVLIEAGMPIRWSFVEASPNLAGLGSWEEVAAKKKARESRSTDCEYKVTRVVDESVLIRSFYLEPLGGGPVPCHQAGQFLPVKVQPHSANKEVQRTYTISNAPNGAYLRLTVKREAGGPDHPPGLVSNELHAHLRPGSVLRARRPSGKFTLADAGMRPVVLLSAGVGITPMISMLEQLAKEEGTCGRQRKVWFIHGARNSQLHAFRDTVHTLTKDWQCATVHYRYSQPLTTDRDGQDYHSTGHIDLDLIKSLLPFDDHEFYICGPESFMQELYSGLKALNIAEQRIHSESFGKTRAKRAAPKALQAATKVRFAASDLEVPWDPSQKTLLELAESAGVEPDSICRSGACQTCATRVVSGQVVYTTPPVSPPDEGYALICCSQPDGDIVLDL